VRCPRCLADDSYVCKEGREAGQTVWTVHYCRTCEFHWRDTEPEATLDPELRPPAFQLDLARPEPFDVILPPKKR
jgi:hypothetical protein